MGIKVSVIIPVYNAEASLAKCLDSIICQSYNSIDILLVDDGSFDSSPQICDNYAEKDERVRVFHKKNGGVSSARNIGLDNARGEWITFIDSDDYISDNYFNCVEDCENDFIIHNFYNYRNGKRCGGIQFETNRVYTSDNLVDFLNQPRTCSIILRGPCSKFYRRSIIGDLRFNEEMKVAEDSCFVFRYVARCRSIEISIPEYYVICDGDVSNEVKYKSSVDYSVRSLLFLLDAFKDLERAHQVGSKNFVSYLGYFKMLSKYEWEKNLKLWYANPQVQVVYDYVWDDMSLSQRIKFVFIKFISKFIPK